MKRLLFLSSLLLGFGGMEAMEGKVRSTAALKTELIKGLLEEYAEKYQELAQSYPKEDMPEADRLDAISAYSQRLADLAMQYKNQIIAINPEAFRNVSSFEPSMRRLPSEQERRAQFLKFLKQYRASIKENVYDARDLAPLEQLGEQGEAIRKRSIAKRLQNVFRNLEESSGIRIDYDFGNMTDDQLASIAESYIF